MLRRSYFTGKLNPILLGTRLVYISEDNRLPAVRAVLPLVHEQHQGVLRHALEDQETHEWELQDDQSPWAILRGPFPYGPGIAEIDDLTNLDYSRLFAEVSPPAG